MQFCRYHTYQLATEMPGGEKLVGFTRILHRTQPDILMTSNEVCSTCNPRPYAIPIGIIEGRALGEARVLRKMGDPCERLEQRSTPCMSGLPSENDCQYDNAVCDHVVSMVV